MTENNKKSRKYQKLLFLLPISIFTLFTACESVTDTDLDGKWLLKEVIQADGSVHQVDTVWYNFQNTLFMYQWYDKNGEERQYHQMYGFKIKESDNLIRLEMQYYSMPVDSFLMFTDWNSGIRSFNVDKKTSKSLILSSEGKEYHFTNF